MFENQFTPNRPSRFTALKQAAAALAVLTGFAGAQDLTGLTALKTELGSGVPTGAGITVAQMESAVGGAYMPQDSAGSTSAIAGAGSFLGKSLVPMAGASGASAHAQKVAATLFGTDGGVASGVAQSLHYSSSQWLFRTYLKPADTKGVTLEPKTDGALVQNHSWIGSAASASQNDLLRRLDFAADRDGITVVVGTSNGNSTNVPQLMTSAYNAISVGLVSGNHGAGLVAAASSDGQGRQKPDLVAPADYVSYAAPQVSGAASLLLEVAKKDAAPAEAARPETIKAVLLAGATEAGLSAPLSRSTERPLDARFGAGTLNIKNSVHIMTEKATSAGASTGWTLQNAPTFDQSFEIPAQRTGLEFKAALTWHRTLKDGAANGFDPIPDSLANLRLEVLNFETQQVISTSDSAVDNVELITAANLPAGRYVLRVTGDKAVRFGLAWRTELSAPVPTAPAPLAATPTVIPTMDFSLVNSGKSGRFAFKNLKVGKKYIIQCTNDMTSWKEQSNFQAAGGSLNLTFLLTPSMNNCFYRLVPADGTF